MERNVNDVVFDILVAIDYPNDKNAFVKQFQQVNHSNAILNILERLPQDLQKKLKAKKDPNEVVKYVDQEEYKTEVTKVSFDALKRFIEAIRPSLTLDQKEKVLKVLQPENI